MESTRAKARHHSNAVALFYAGTWPLFAPGLTFSFATEQNHNLLNSLNSFLVGLLQFLGSEQVIHVDLQRSGQFLQSGGRPGFALRFNVDDLNTVHA